MREREKYYSEAMLEECTRTERLGITMYNFHPGDTILSEGKT